MFNVTLFKYGLRGSWKTLLIFIVVLTMYVSVMISMYDPELMGILDGFTDAMPGFMAAIGMTSGAATLIGFMTSYLYGFILIVFPMVFAILSAGKVIARHVDKGSMTYLLTAPVKRRAVAFTQMTVVVTGVFALVLYITALELVLCGSLFPDALDVSKVLTLNLGLLCLHLFIGGVCFLCSCLFNESKYSTGFGAGIPALMFIIQMLGSAGGKAENAKYVTFFTLFNPDGLIAGDVGAVSGLFILFIGAIVLFGAAIAVFSKKDLHI
jgi:ABC-2 type transport system permease protein